MLVYLRGKAGERKLRLFALACCRRVWPLLRTVYREGVGAAERFADGAEGQELLEAVQSAPVSDLVLEELESDWAREGCRAGGELLRDWASAVWQAEDAVAVATDPEFRGVDYAYWAAETVYSAAGLARRLVAGAGGRHGESPVASVTGDDADEEARYQASLLRDLFGNPFRPAPVMPPAWLLWNGGAIPRLAQAVYEERILPAWGLDPARLALLADMLTDAGCTDADILDHCRSGGDHVRGCWVVDALLAKE
jgi:hypothetical protein